jgi:hypothetical protein
MLMGLLMGTAAALQGCDIFTPRAAGADGSFYKNPYDGATDEEIQEWMNKGDGGGGGGGGGGY